MLHLPMLKQTNACHSITIKSWIIVINNKINNLLPIFHFNCVGWINEVPSINLHQYCLSVLWLFEKILTLRISSRSSPSTPFLAIRDRRDSGSECRQGQPWLSPGKETKSNELSLSQRGIKIASDFGKSISHLDWNTYQSCLV